VVSSNYETQTDILFAQAPTPSAALAVSDINDHLRKGGKAMKWEEMVRWQKVVAVIVTVCAAVALLLLFFGIAFSLMEPSGEYVSLSSSVVWLEVASYALMALASLGLGLLQKKRSARVIWFSIAVINVVTCVLKVIAEFI